MDIKDHKAATLSPLVSDHIWACNEPTKDWKVIGHSSLGRARSKSIVGDIVSGRTPAGVIPWSSLEDPLCDKKRSMSTSAISGLALKLGLEENGSKYKGLCTALKEGLVKPEAIKMEKGTLTSLRRHSLDPTVFYEVIKAEKLMANKNRTNAFPAKSTTDKVCLVQFGSGSKCFGIYKGVFLAKGTFVIIEADRGEDCGAVLLECPTKCIPEIAQKYGLSSLEIKQIYRIATEQDKLLLLEQNELEAEAVRSCRDKVEAKNLAMEIVSAEYQWDRNKLTFYFKSEKRVDFRDLVKDLYKVYKTRIWMCAVEKKGAPLKPELIEDYGLDDTTDTEDLSMSLDSQPLSR
ncbi:hypothetical protein NEHOM01_0343 [Nematocida homosporus]|uniref:uncharacterized protein n=1 Tax=Nematocida homosporus TaxID=1912981 RepID=UPI00221EF9CB|nr:uncharacterized protein NEHOM01_0343 [Nematocida homosporus]KAI5184741.1 hypothetical protein NEHOM01_0343 [Nematocida homosporus]